MIQGFDGGFILLRSEADVAESFPGGGVLAVLVERMLQPALGFGQVGDGGTVECEDAQIEGGEIGGLGGAQILGHGGAGLVLAIEEQRHEGVRFGGVRMRVEPGLQENFCVAPVWGVEQLAGAVEIGGGGGFLSGRWHGLDDRGDGRCVGCGENAAQQKYGGRPGHNARHATT